ncbi:hypothetical protein ACHQM5_027267 [Ranunculus cassubicifolius]
MEGNESSLNSYYTHHHHQPPTGTTNNGIFPNTQPHHPQNHNSHVSSPHYSSPAQPTNRGHLLPTAPPVPVVETVKRKRGRPRKYGSGTPDVQQSFSAPSSSTSHKNTSSKTQLNALGNAGHGFTPHIITVAAGEDAAQKILSFVQQRKCAVCILSASGSISNALLRQPATLGGNVTYEGRFEILSLSGSFLYNEIGGSRNGALSVCLSGSDGRIIGGGVAGPLRAAGPVQVIAGTFIFDATKNSEKRVETSLDKSPPPPPQVVLGASITSVTFRDAPDPSFSRSQFRENDDHQSIVGNYMIQPRAMDANSPGFGDWRGGLDSRSDIEFGGPSFYEGRTDNGESQSAEDDGDDE